MNNSERTLQVINLVNKFGAESYKVLTHGVDENQKTEFIIKLKTKYNSNPNDTENKQVKFFVNKFGEIEYFDKIIQDYKVFNIDNIHILNKQRDTQNIFNRFLKYLTIQEHPKTTIFTDLNKMLIDLYNINYQTIKNFVFKIVDYKDKKMIHIGTNDNNYIIIFGDNTIKETKYPIHEIKGAQLFMVTKYKIVKLLNTTTPCYDNNDFMEKNKFEKVTKMVFELFNDISDNGSKIVHEKEINKIEVSQEKQYELSLRDNIKSVVNMLGEHDYIKTSLKQLTNNPMDVHNDYTLKIGEDVIHILQKGVYVEYSINDKVVFFFNILDEINNVYNGQKFNDIIGLNIGKIIYDIVIRYKINTNFCINKFFNHLCESINVCYGEIYNLLKTPTSIFIKSILQDDNLEIVYTNDNFSTVPSFYNNSDNNKYLKSYQDIISDIQDYIDKDINTTQFCVNTKPKVEPKVEPSMLDATNFYLFEQISNLDDVKSSFEKLTNGKYKNIFSVDSFESSKPSNDLNDVKQNELLDFIDFYKNEPRTLDILSGLMNTQKGAPEIVLTYKRNCEKVNIIFTMCDVVIASVRINTTYKTMRVSYHCNEYESYKFSIVGLLNILGKIKLSCSEFFGKLTNNVTTHFSDRTKQLIADGMRKNYLFETTYNTTTGNFEFVKKTDNETSCYYINVSLGLMTKTIKHHTSGETTYFGVCNFDTNKYSIFNNEHGNHNFFYPKINEFDDLVSLSDVKENNSHEQFDLTKISFELFNKISKDSMVNNGRIEKSITQYFRTCYDVIDYFNEYSRKNNINDRTKYDFCVSTFIGVLRSTTKFYCS